MLYIDKAFCLPIQKHPHKDILIINYMKVIFLIV